MPRLTVICQGASTCLKECPCKVPHHITPDKPCDDPGSCWHNEHSDGEYHECGHDVVKPTTDDKKCWHCGDTKFNTYGTCLNCGRYNSNMDISATITNE